MLAGLWALPARANPRADLEAGMVAQAAVAAHRALASAPSPEERQELERLLAESLRRMGLVRTALLVDDPSIAGPSRTAVSGALSDGAGLGPVLQAAEALGDASLVPGFSPPSVLATALRLTPARVAAASLLAAEVQVRAGELAPARALLAGAADWTDAAHRARAEYLLGVIEAAEERPEDPEGALRHFERARRSRLGDEDGSGQRDEMWDLATLGQARAAYRLGRWSEADRLDREIPPQSPWFGRALVEEAWARFRAGDLAGALGALMAFRAPQLQGRFEPEAAVLEATVLHSACLYGPSEQALARFDRWYASARPALQAAREAAREPAVALALAHGGALPRPLLAGLLRARSVRAVLAAIEEASQEEARIDQRRELREGGLAAALGLALARDRDWLAAEGVARVRARLSVLLREADDLAVAADAVRVEDAAREREAYEAGREPRPAFSTPGARSPVAKGEDDWKYDGEFWLDELDHVKVTFSSPPGCRAGALSGAGDPPGRGRP
jgi:tetratricopeptide (TPR) repeat protein